MIINKKRRKHYLTSEDVVKETDLHEIITYVANDQQANSQHDVMSRGIDADENRIYFYSHVTDKDVFELTKILKNLDVEMQCISLRLKIPPIPIELHIHSAGGDLFSGLAAADVIRSCTSPIHTYVNGSTASAATLMSMCGSKRFMYKNAYMLIHQISSVIIQGKFEEFKDEMENQEKLMSQIKSIYLEKSKMSEQQIEDLLKHDLWLPAETCLEYGLVDEIV